MSLASRSTHGQSRLDLARQQVVGIGELLVGDAETASIAAVGLGSCVCLAAWDPLKRIGGMAHFMLPTGGRIGSLAKYVDTGLVSFVAALSAAGATPRRCQLKAAGGAAMFVGVSASLEVGRRNADALRAAVSTAGLRLVAQDLGGTIGRSVQLDLRTGHLTIRTIHGISNL